MKLQTKKYFFLVSIFLMLNVIYSPAFSLTADETVKIYQAEKNKIEELENKAQYHGDDEQIRSRLNLPAKIPTYEEWIKLNIDSIEAKQNQPVAEASEPVKQQEETVKSSTVIEEKIGDTTTGADGISCVIKTDSNGKSRQVCNLTEYENIINYSVFILLLLINFIVYSNSKKLRFLLISTPFDLFVKKDADTASLPSNYKKYFYELILFALFAAGYFAMSKEFKSTPEENYLSTLGNSVFAFVFFHIAYLIIRLIVAFSSRCPKCKMTYASRSQNSYDEPKSTYEKRYTNWVDIRETGISVSEYMCINCNHQWKKTKSYDKSIGKNH